MIGDIYSVEHTVDLNGSPASSFFFLRTVAEPTPGPYPSRVLANSWYADFEDYRRNLLSASCRLANIHVVKRSGVPEPPYRRWDRDFPGTRSGSLISTTAAILLTLRHNEKPYLPAGRLYLAGPSQNDQHEGRWLNSFASNQLTDFCLRITQPITEVFGGVGVWEFVTISKSVVSAGGYTDTAWSAAAASVSYCQFSGTIAELRKRRQRVKRHGLNDTQPNPVS